jgi:hypothetical protein
MKKKRGSSTGNKKKKLNSVPNNGKVKTRTMTTMPIPVPRTVAMKRNNPSPKCFTFLVFQLKYMFANNRMP